MEPRFEEESPPLAVGAGKGIGAGERAEEFVPRPRLSRPRVGVDAQKKPHP